jgi:hypothetical protein
MSGIGGFSTVNLAQLYRTVFGIATQRYDQVGLPVSGPVAFPYLGDYANQLLGIKRKRYNEAEKYTDGERVLFEKTGKFEAANANEWTRLQAQTEDNRKHARDYFGKPFLLPIELDGFVLWNEPSIEISGQTDIIATRPLTGEGKSFVVEITGEEPAELAIKGFIIRYDDQYPQGEIRQIRKWAEKKKLTIGSKFTDALGIRNVVLKSWRLPDYRGNIGIQPYEIILVEDQTFEAKVLGKKQ